MSAVDLVKWIAARVGELDQKGNISKEAIERIILFVGSDTVALDAELQKLVNYSAGKNDNRTGCRSFGQS